MLHHQLQQDDDHDEFLTRRPLSGPRVLDAIEIADRILERAIAEIEERLLRNPDAQIALRSAASLRARRNLAMDLRRRVEVEIERGASETRLSPIEFTLIAAAWGRLAKGQFHSGRPRFAAPPVLIHEA
jgi:hypothetical protein